MYLTNRRQRKAGAAAMAGILLLAAGCRTKPPEAQAPAANPQNQPPAGTQAAAYLGKAAAGHTGPRPPGGWDRSAR